MTLSVQQLVARQIRLWEALKAEHPSGPAKHTPRPVITISREAGIDALPLAIRLSQRLGYSVWDQQILDYIARSSGTRRQFLESLEERDQTAVERWVEGALRGHLFDTGDYARALVEVIRALGEQGNAIIIGRGANYVIAPERAIRVRLAAPLGYRVTLAQREDEEEGDVEKRLIKEDRTRRDFVVSTMKSNPDDPSGYDIVINVERLDAIAQSRIVMELLHARIPDPDALLRRRRSTDRPL